MESMLERNQLTLSAVVRGIRARNKWTLREMSDRCGMSISTLSKVEHDRLTLTYDKLQQMSQRLNISMSDLFSEESNRATDAGIGRRSVGTLADAVRVTTKNYDYYYLCPELSKKRMIPQVTKVRAKSLKEFGELVRHDGEEFVYVAEGQVIVHTEFYEPLTLNAGESIYINSAMGHAYLAGEGCEEALTIGVMSSGNEELTESLMQLHGATMDVLERTAA